jgi:hypothetical protein
MEFNSTINIVENNANIIGPIIGGLIAAGAGILVYEIQRTDSINERQRLVAKALYEEMVYYYDNFELLFEDCNTIKFDKAIQETEEQAKRKRRWRRGRSGFWDDNDDTFEPARIYEYEKSVLDQIKNLKIGTTGSYASFIPEKNPFTNFYDDIYNFDDIEEIRNLIQFYRYLMVADKYYRSYCCEEDEDSRNYFDLRRFLDEIENAYSLMRETTVLEYLKKKSHPKRLIWNRVFNSKWGEHIKKIIKL